VQQKESPSSERIVRIESWFYFNWSFDARGDQLDLKISSES